MTIAIGSDHAGFKYKEMIKEYLQVKSVWISTATDVPNPFIQR